MQDAADHPPIVDTASTRPAVRQVRLDLRPSLIAQPVEIVHAHLRRDPTDIDSERSKTIKVFIEF